MPRRPRLLLGPPQLAAVRSRTKLRFVSGAHSSGPPQLAGVRSRARHAAQAGYSPNVSREALPPAAVVLMVTVFSVVKRGR